MSHNGLYRTRATRKLKAKKGHSLSPGKAKKILRDGEIRGHKLTKKQRGFFGAVAGK